MKRRCKWHVLGLLSAGLVFGGGCGASIVDSVLVGSLDFLTGQVSSGLGQAIPLDLFIADLIRNTFAPG